MALTKVMLVTQRPKVRALSNFFDANKTYSAWIGFTRDIGAAPSDLNLAVSLFFITFVLFQPPSAALGRWIGPQRWIPFMTVCILPCDDRPNADSVKFSWGALTIGQAFIKGRGKRTGRALQLIEQHTDSFKAP